MTNDQTLEQMRQMSERDGRAYVAIRIPFSAHEIRSYRCPSAIPDCVIDLAVGDRYKDAVAYKGKLQGFTRSALGREETRGYGCE